MDLQLAFLSKPGGWFSGSKLINILLGLILPAALLGYILFWSTGGLQAVGAVTLRWGDLAGLDLKTGKLNRKMKSAVNREVRIPGFMIPLEDDFEEETSEFLLVPYPMACIHVPAPPANQLVHVVMKDRKKIKLYWYEPIWMTGVLKVQRHQSELAETNYSMVGLRATPYEGDYEY
ncbi:MAG: hypothetical protein CMN76_07515 [Spirochaetaceae bacterium]|nr:hypothetical protein [Spirochaetaceae bacterium]|tara:strand:+ start:7064 stop:7591 length:528 start_codon:yes stop_codon:yes gene_type:complete